jgi:AraC family transcriptional regulator
VLTTLLESASGLRISRYCCAAGPDDVPFTEVFEDFSLSYVSRGSFGCFTRGRQLELVAGSFLIGRARDEFQCTHEHHDGGDECLSFHWNDAALDAIEVDCLTFESGALPAIAALPLLGAYGRSVLAAQADDCVLEEIAVRLAHSFASLRSGNATPRLARLTSRDRQRAVLAALFIDSHANEAIRLQDIAALTKLSPFHFLRLFTRVTGLTPHQYLLRTRLRHAAELLADPGRRISDIAFEVGFGDLSNFIKAFRAAAGMSPGQFRLLPRSDRKIYQAAWRPSK